MNKLLLYSLVFLITAINARAQVIVPNASSVPAAQHVAYLPAAFNSGAQINYVRIWEPWKPITDPAAVVTETVGNVKQATSYVDGLGRVVETVSKQGSPSGKDMVSYKTFDSYGHEVQQYLPYASSGTDGYLKTNPFEEQQTYYSTPSLNNNQYTGEQVYYSKTDFETSPLGRPIKSMAPGNSWAGSERGVSYQYKINTSADAVRIWTIAEAAGSTPQTSVTYPAGELYKNITTDEGGKQVIEYKDKEGKVILKKVQVDNTPGVDHTGWLCTYYVYDDYGLLRFVIQPKAVEARNAANNWTLSTPEIDELCFRYEYDYRNRMITKKVPGASEVWMVYDTRDRLVFSQDGNMRAKNWWMTNLYDEQNRTIATGMTFYTGTREQLVSYAADAAHLSGTTTVTIQGSALLSNLSVSNRESGKPFYHATTTIELTDGFESESTAEFTAEIVTTASTSSTMIVSGSPLPSGGVFTPLTLSYFDNYAFTQKAYDNTNNTKLSDVGTGANPETLPSVASLMVHGNATGGKVWIMNDANDLANGSWLEAVSFYDDKGRSVQVQSENVNGGKEEIITRYDFSGKVAGTYQLHNNPSASANIMRVKTYMDYDASGRLITIKKQLNDDVNSTKTTVQSEYDELGQLKNKKLGTDPHNTSLPLESLAFEYNIRGWLKGINKDFVDNGTSASSKYFGQTLSYDNGFSTQQYNGNISGIQWRSKGDNEQRAYGFEYDNLNRLSRADFTQYTGSAWNTSAGLDFSVSGRNGKMEYDQNGNILYMKQKGWKMGGSITMDDMKYEYTQSGVSNKLLSVTEETSIGNTNFKLGDFTDNNTTNDDYDYDVNGNMKLDKNKSISSVIYNHLNLPSLITVTGKGTIAYTYDATGAKLKKTVIETASGSNPQKITTTTYMGSFIYEQVNTGTTAGADRLQFFAHEEGRTRPTRDANNTITGYVYDYFIKDHLGNVRMTLTEESKVNKYPVASLEDSKISTEQSFYDINTSQVVSSSAYSLPTYINDNGIGNNPADASFEATNSLKAYRLNSSSAKTGLGIRLKVMAGDRIDILGKSYYNQNNTGGSSANTSIPILDIITGLLGGTTGVVSATNETISATQLNSQSGTTSGISTLLANETTDNNANTSVPKAYINYLFFDEQFKYVSSGFSKVGSNSVLKDHFSDLQNITVPKNGYVYIYCSNESPVDVFFDNLQVVHTQGPIVEETHYYPFGLTVQGISSKATQFGDPKNTRNKFQNQEFNDDLGVDGYEFKYRMDDPQIGRFWQEDPLANDYVYNSTYAFSENKVTGHIELEGLESKSINPPNQIAPNRPAAESVNQNHTKVSIADKIKFGYKIVKSEPLFSVNVSVGAQIGAKAGPVGVEINGGSKELFSVSDQGVKGGNLNETKKGMELSLGMASIGGESTSSTETLTANSLFGPISYDQTTITNTYSASIGIPNTPLKLSKQRELIYTQNSMNGFTSDPKLIYDSRSLKGGGSYMPEKSVGSGNTKVSVSLFVKVEASFNIMGILGLIHN